MVTGAPSASGGRTSTRTSTRARFLQLLPALALAQLSIIAWVLAVALPRAAWTGTTAAGIAASAVAADVLGFLAALPLLFVLAWPLLRINRPRAWVVAVGVGWSLFLLAQVALHQYFLVARTPLGAEILAYSANDLRTAVSDGVDSGARAWAGWLLPLLVLWLGLAWRARRPLASRAGATAVVLLLAGAAGAWFAPMAAQSRWIPSDAARELALAKPDWFARQLLRAAFGQRAAAGQVGDAGGHSGTPASAYPFQRAETTPDVLGEFFKAAPGGPPPNVVVVVVEGLGRSFSGPGAVLGSFTPFLDELATRSLYFDNFLANQGRTFGVLPSLLGSLPFAERGVLAMNGPLPEHPGLLQVLGRQGYDTGFALGSDARFDNQLAYLQAQGVRRIVDRHAFGPGYALNPFSEWGYADDELVSQALADAPALRPPFVQVIQTMSMHTSFRFPGQDAYRAGVERRLDALGTPPSARRPYREQADIYSAILFTDAQLRRYFEGAARQPWYRNTIFVVTGDHRLAEIAHESHADRYHVPLIIFSPLLRKPARIGAMSSHVDVTPSLVALLSHGFGLQRPATVGWVGAGLDMSPGFGNRHEIQLKASKTSPVELASGRWWLRDGSLYEVREGMQLAPARDREVLRAMQARLDRYNAANARFARVGQVLRAGASGRLVAYDESTARQRPLAQDLPMHAGVGVVAARIATDRTRVAVDATFANGDAAVSPVFVPLAVLVDAQGRELREGYGAALQVPVRGQRTVRVEIATTGVPAGRYFLSVLPSHPDTGKLVGRGRYRMPLDVPGHATAGPGVRTD